MVAKDYVVIGGGVVGASAAYELAKQGKEVLLIERDKVGAPNPISSSGDHSKVFRHSYGSDFHSTKMCAESLKLWREIESASGKELYVPCGMIVFGKEPASGEAQKEWYSWAKESAVTMRSLDLPFEMLSAREVAKRYPQVIDNGRYDHALLDKASGFIKAREGVQTIGELAEKAGAEVWPGTTVEDVVSVDGKVQEIITDGGAVVPRKAVIMAAGYMNNALVPELKERTFVTRQQTIYVKPKVNQNLYMPENFPIVVSLGEGFYAFPLHGDGFSKTSNHDKTERCDPRDFKKTVDDSFVAACVDFLSKYVPDLAEGEIVDKKVCLYTNTANADFIIDRKSNMVIASPCSGHGFKFGPLTGRMAAQLALDQKPVLWTPRFALESHK